MMPATGNFLGDLRDFRKLHRIARAGILTEAVPGSHAVILNLAGLHGRFEKRKCFADTSQEFCLGNFGKLCLRIVQVINVYALDAQIFQAAAELVFQKFRRHAMTSRRNILRAEDSRLNVFAEKIFIGVGGHRTVGRQVAALGAHHDFVAFEALCC